jgi:hypothetical protein
MRYLEIQSARAFSCVRTRFDVAFSTEQNKPVRQSSAL